MKQEKQASAPAYFRRLFDRYKYVLAVCLAGLVLMLWPQPKPRERPPEPVPAAADTQALAHQLEALLGEMEGVGRVRVLLTLEQGEAAQYAFDRTQTENRMETGGSRTVQTELVTVSRNGGQGPVQVRQTAPVYRGAAVVCQGGGNASVRLAVLETVHSLTGIPSDHIVISKMK